MNKNNAIGFFGALTLILFVLKILNLIHCSWVWVFAPLWLPVAAVVLISFILFSLVLISERLKK